MANEGKKINVMSTGQHQSQLNSIHSHTLIKGGHAG